MFYLNGLRCHSMAKSHRHGWLQKCLQGSRSPFQSPAWTVVTIKQKSDSMSFKLVYEVELDLSVDLCHHSCFIVFYLQRRVVHDKLFSVYFFSSWAYFSLPSLLLIDSFQS